MSSGYAFVKFTRDQLTKVVPLSYIQDIDKDNFSTTRQYWVFWSRGSMTPEEFLKETATIPKISNDVAAAETTDTGYYRATISVVTDTEAEMQETLAKKRARHVSVKKLEGESFDASMVALRKDNKKKSQKEKAEEKQLRKGGSRNNIRSILEQNPDMHTAMKIQEKDAVKSVTKRLQSKSSHSKQGQKNTSSRSSKGRGRYSHQSSSSESEVDSDMCPSPTKYMELKGKVQEQEFTIQRVRSLNEKLQDVLFAKEEEIKKLKAEKSENTGTIGKHQSAHISAIGGQRFAEVSKMRNFHSKENELPTQFKDGKPEVMEEPQRAEKALSVADKDDVSDRANSIENSPTLVDDEFTTPSTNHEETLESIVDSPQIASEQPPPAIASSSSTGTPVAETSPLSPHLPGAKRAYFSMALDNTSPKSKKKKGLWLDPKFAHLKDYELYPGEVLPAKLVQFMFSRVPEGKTGDSRFVKTMAVKLWGSNHLASHTVAGRKDPKLSKKDPGKAEDNLREALDEERLRALTRAMHYRLQVEGVDPEKVADDPRAKKAVIHGYVRDKIKTLRSAKFGLENQERPKCEEELEETEFLENIEVYDQYM